VNIPYKFHRDYSSRSCAIVETNLSRRTNERGGRTTRKHNCFDDTSGGEGIMKCVPYNLGEVELGQVRLLLI